MHGHMVHVSIHNAQAPSPVGQNNTASYKASIAWNKSTRSDQKACLDRKMLMASICSGIRRIPAKTTRRNNHVFFDLTENLQRSLKHEKQTHWIIFKYRSKPTHANQRNLILDDLRHTLQAIFHEEGLLSKSLSHCPDEAISAHPQDLFSSPPNNVGIERLRDTVSLLLYIVDWEWLNDSNDPRHVFGSWKIENLWSQSQRPAWLTASHSLLEF